MDETRGDPPGSGLPRNGGDGLNPRQRETAGELRRLDPDLAGLFEHGLALVREINQPGNAYLLAHAGRELSNGVLELLLRDEGLEVTAADLENVSSNERHRPRIAKALGLEAHDPRVDEWFHLARQFAKGCHWRYGGPELAPLREAFERFASVLYGRVAPYYSTEVELNVLLGIETPAPKHAKKLRDLQLRPGQRNYFFTQLENPGWVKHLAAEGFFRDPPGLQNNADGSWSAKPWPEGDYLVSAAIDEPMAVLEALKSIPLTNANPVVWDHVAEAANQLPPEMAVYTIPSLTNALKTVPAWMFTESVANLIVALAEAGREESFNLAAFLLRVVDPDDVRGAEELHFSLRKAWVFPSFRSHGQAELLKRIVSALEALDTKRTLELLFSKVRRLQQLADDPDFGLGWWLIDIQPGSRPDHDDVVAMLINEAVGVGQRLAARGRDEASWVMDLVDHDTAKLVTRIGYLVLSVAGQHLQERIDALLCSNEIREPGFPATEIALLLRSQFRNASPEARTQYSAAVLAGPNREEIATGWLRAFGRDLTQEEIDQRIQDYQRRILIFFRGDIPEELRDLAEGLGVFGVTPSHRDQRLAEVGSDGGGGMAHAVSEISPISNEELRQWSPDEVAALLAASNSEEGSEASYGLPGTLMTYAKENPKSAVAVLNNALGLGVSPRAIRGIVDGLGDAAKAASAIDWAATLVVVRGILRQVRLLGLGVDTDVRQWRRTAGRAARLIEEGCTSNSVGHVLADELWTLIGEAMAVPAIWEVSQSGDTSLQAVVLATLNDASGNVANAALAAALWDYRSLLGDEQQASARAKTDACAAVQEHLVPVLDGWLRSDGPNAPVLRAVMGNYLPQLHLLAPEWIEANAAELFGHGLEDPASWPTWTVYIARGHLDDDVFRATRPWYLKAAEGAMEWREAVGDSFSVREITQHYGAHLIVAVVRGLVSVGDKDALIETAYEHIHPSDWRGAYWSIFRGWSDADAPPPTHFVRRLLRLWEWRVSQLGMHPDSAETVEEAKALGWLFHTPHLPASDRVRLGLETARLAKGQIKMYSRWNHMLAFAKADPDATFLIAETVLLAELRADYPHVPVEDVRPFLAHSLKAGGPDIRARARRLINRLGERGYRELRDLLDENEKAGK